MKALGLDHADVRVTSLAAVEAFYDRVLPALGLTSKSDSHVAADGEWHPVDPARPRNVVEYATPSEPGSRGWFIGFIEDPHGRPNGTRIAIALGDEADLPAVEALLRDAGAGALEWSDDDGYPAIFFEDPAGTRLEICARRPRP